LAEADQRGRSMGQLFTGVGTFSVLAGLLLLVNKLFPWLVDRIMRRKVRALFKDEIAARENQVPVSV